MAVALASLARPRTVVDLEDLVVWAIRDQKADRDRVALHAVEVAAEVAIGRHSRRAFSNFSPGGGSVDSCVRIARHCMPGTRIDGGGQIRGVAPRLHRDAEAVMAAVERLPDRRLRGIIIQEARAGGRPDWRTAPQRLCAVENDAPGGRRHEVAGAWEDVPLRSQVMRRMMARGIRTVDAQGRSVVPAADKGFTYRTLDDGSRQVLVRWSPLRLDPSDVEIRTVREHYAAWHAGMMRLLGELLTVPLRDYELRGFGAPAAPWR